MISIQDVIKNLQVKIPVEKPMATDEELVAVLKLLTSRGYRVSDQIVEPVRAMISGYGVLLSGRTGVGKTYLMKCMKSAALYTAQSICDWGISRLHGWYEWTDKHNVVIDDLGIERITSEFGNREEVMNQVIAHRCELHDVQTHITTNFTSEEISHRYGDRTLSRILGMCRPYTMTGVSMRKPEAV